MLEDNRLKIFKAVAEEGNFTRAARSLGITQPAVSLAIAELEREAGVLLVDRTRGAVRLTAAGESFLRYADAVLRDYAALNTLFGAAGHVRSSRPVTCSAAPFIQEYLLPDALSDIRAVSSVAIVLLPEGAEADFALRLAPASGTLDFDEGAETVGGLSAVAVACGRPAEGADLLAWAPYRPLLTAEETARVSLVTDSLTLLTDLLRRSPGTVAYLPLPAVPADLQVLPVQLPHLSLDVRLVRDEAFSRTVAGAFFRERLADALKKSLSLTAEH